MAFVLPLTAIYCIVFFLRSTNASVANTPDPNENRIVGGDDTTIEEYPHQCGMVVNGSNFCGCSIISEYWITTAAHCVDNIDDSGVDLRAGSTYRSRGQKIPIAEVISHPDYDNPEFDNDVAVMRTVDPIQFTDTIQPVKLVPRGKRLTPGTHIRASGWGLTSPTGTTIPEHLQDVELTILQQYQCRMSYPSAFNPNSMFCAGNYFMGGQGTCEGDSGGGVVQNNTLVGSVAFGRNCGSPGSPSVFMDYTTDAVRDFLANHTLM